MLRGESAACRQTQDGLHGEVNALTATAAQLEAAVAVETSNAEALREHARSSGARIGAADASNGHHAAKPSGSGRISLDALTHKARRLSRRRAPSLRHRRLFTSKMHSGHTVPAFCCNGASRWRAQQPPVVRAALLVS